MIKPEIKLSEREIEILKALKILGCKWLTRDRNSILFAYLKKPVKLTSIWDTDENWCYVNIKYIKLFRFIKWEDTKPTKIDDLLKELNK